MFRNIISIIGMFFLFGCAQEDDVNHLDLNRDGINDISYEFDKDYYYEFIDFDFDGKVDVTNKYSNDHILVSNTFDEDNDGISESSTVFQHGNALYTIVDLDLDKTPDIVHIFLKGYVKCSFKLLSAVEPNKYRLGMFKYKFGFPDSSFQQRYEISRDEYTPEKLTQECKASLE